MENLTDFQLMWIIYGAGALGCALATWMLFRRAGRAWVHFFVITVLVLLLTPYGLEMEAQHMMMAPAIFTLAFGYLDGGFIAIKPVVKLMLGIWALALVLSLVYQLLTRHRQSSVVAPQTPPEDDEYHDPTDVLLTPRSSRQLNREEQQARADLMNEEPIRAIR